MQFEKEWMSSNKVLIFRVNFSLTNQNSRSMTINNVIGNFISNKVVSKQKWRRIRNKRNMYKK